MAFIPKDAKWYLADIVQEIRVSTRKRQSVWINTVLIRADSPEEAYKKAHEIGRAGDLSYLNVYKEKVQLRFRGLKELSVIDEELAHGSELFFRSKTRMTAKGIGRLICDKQKLSVFDSSRTNGWTMFADSVEEELKRDGIEVPGMPRRQRKK